MFLRFAVCDDDIHMTGKIETMLFTWAETESIDIEVEVFCHAQELINSIEQGRKYDILYLDIEMKPVDGMRAAREVRKVDETVLIIYVTSHESYATEAFEVRPFRFIVKPVQEDQFLKYLKAAVNEIQRDDFYFRFKYRKANYRVLVQDIIYFESRKRKIYIYTDSETLELYDKLDDIELVFKDTKAQFLRIHKSFLVNRKYIKRHYYDSIELLDGTSLNISTDKRKEVSRRLCEILGGEIIA